MPEHHSNSTLTAAADLIKQATGTIFITTHAKPDGDAFGSVVALSTALRKLGKETFPCFAPPVASQLADLKGHDQAHTLNEDLSIPDCGLYIIVDTGAWSQVAPLRETLEPNLAKTLIIDHHLSGDINAAHKYIDADAGACAEIIAELLDLLDESASTSGGGGALSPWDATTAEALFVGIGSDTGWFRFSNTRPQTHRLAARLLELGVDHADLYARLHQTERPAKLMLLSRALTSMTLLAGERAAVMSLSKQDFADSGALEEETERLIDVPQQARSIQVVALVTESSIQTDAGPKPLARISFRSKPKSEGGPDAVNVADLAAKFGGGGHARAAGAKLQAPFDEAVQQVKAAIESAF